MGYWAVQEALSLLVGRSPSLHQDGEMTSQKLKRKKKNPPKTAKDSHCEGRETPALWKAKQLFP